MIKAFTYLLFTASLVIAVQLWAEAQPKQEQNDYSMICDHPDYDFSTSMQENDMASSVETRAQNPVNDDCVNAMFLDIDTENYVDTFHLNNIGASTGQDIVFYRACGQAYMSNFSTPTDVWYRFRAKAIKTSISVQGLEEAHISLFQDGDCNDLAQIACTTPLSGEVFYRTSPNQEYLIRVAGGDEDDQAYFDVEIKSISDNHPIVVDVDILPFSVGNIYEAGDTVQVCYTVTQWGVGIDEWLHGVNFDFGEGFGDIVDMQVPQACKPGTGQWDWYDEWYSENTAYIFYNGFAFNNHPIVDNPGSNFGDCDEITDSNPFSFCISLEVESLSQSSLANDLGIQMYLLSDQISGSWNGPGFYGESLFETNIYRPCDHPDYVTLMKMFLDLDGENWAFHGTANEPDSETVGWGRDCEPCNWYGVQCNEEGRVTCIDLDGTVDCDETTTGVGNYLSGNVPVYLINEIPFLTFLDLSDNILKGFSSDTISELSSLNTLSLNNNEIKGHIPLGLSNLTELDDLLLNNNQLEGCYPDELEDWLCGSTINYNFLNNPQLPWLGDFQQVCLGQDEYLAPCDDERSNTDESFINQNCDCQGIRSACSFYEVTIEVDNTDVCLGDSVVVRFISTADIPLHNVFYKERIGTQVYNRYALLSEDNTITLKPEVSTDYSFYRLRDNEYCDAFLIGQLDFELAVVNSFELRAEAIDSMLVLHWQGLSDSYTLSWIGPISDTITTTDTTFVVEDFPPANYIFSVNDTLCRSTIELTIGETVTNGQCDDAITLELGQPTACLNTIADTSVFELTNIGSPLSNFPLSYCGDVLTPTPLSTDVWYDFEATGSTTILEIDGLSAAQFYVYSGICDDLSRITCAVAEYEGEILRKEIGTEIGHRYFLRISGNDISDQADFLLKVISIDDCENDCTFSTITSYQGHSASYLFEEGDSITICIAPLSWAGHYSGAWLHGLEVNFGAGWDVNEFEAIPPSSFDSLGQWAWYEEWTSCQTGETYGPGFAYDSSQGVACDGQANDGDPGNNWGDGATAEYGVIDRPLNEFCFKLKVGDRPPSTEDDLSLKLRFLSDQVSGSWSEYSCFYSYNHEILLNRNNTAICDSFSFPIDTIIVSSPICAQDNGAISINIIENGLNETHAPYSFEWNTDETTASLNSLHQGIYDVTIQDGYACDTTLSIPLVAEDFLYTCPTDSLIIVNEETSSWGVPVSLPTVTEGCYFDFLQYDIVENGVLVEQAQEGVLSFYVFPVGVTSIYYYPITGGDTCSFNIIVEQEQENCASFAIDAMNVVDPACANNDGFISIVATGGTAPYHYLWSNDSTTASIYNLAAGDYTVSVSDANDCEQTMSFNLVAADALSLSCEQTLLASDYDMADGAAHLGFSGGTQPYTLSVNGEVTTGIFTNTWDLENLNAGFYDIVLQDANNCSTGCTLLIQVDDACDGIDLELTGNLSICENGYTLLTISGADLYYWSVGAVTENLFINEEGAYHVIGSTLDGCEDTLFFEITTMPAPSIELEGVTMVCEEDEATISVSGASNYLWSTASTAAVEFLPVGTHQVIGWSAEGCSDTLDVVIEEIPTPIVSITGDTTVCGDGLTQITASGADYYEWSTGEQDSILSLAAGTYEVEGRTAEDCYAEVLSFTIHSTDLPLIPADYTADYIACTDEAIDIDIALQENQTFKWYTANGFFITQGDVLYNYDVPNDYWVEVLDLETGCVSSQRALIHVLADEQAPVLSNCPVDTTLMLNTSVAPEVLYAWQDPDVIDNCGSVVLSSSHTSPAAFTTDQLITYTATDQAGNVANCSFTVNIVRTDSLAFYVDTTDLVYYGDTLEVGLGVVAMDDISAWQLALSLSNLVGSEFIDIVELHPALGNTLVDELYDSNEGISLRWNELDGSSNANLSLADSTLLLRLRMKVGGNYGDCLGVNFDIDHLNPMAYKTDIGSVSVNTEDRVVCRPTTASIAGYVLKENHVSVADVALRLHQSSTTDTLTTLTNTEGYYQFDDVTLGQDYSLSAFRDGDDSNGVDLVDITLMRSDYLYGTPVYEYLTSAYKVIAADITKNDTFGVEDLSAGVYLLLNDEFPADVNNTSWRFVNEDYLFPDMRAPWNPMIPETRSIVDLDRHELEEDFVGVKIADIDLNANTAFVANVALSLEDKEYEAGEILYVPIHLASVEHIEALSFELEANGLEFVAVDYENRAFGQLFSSTNKKTGKLRAVYLANEHIGRYAESDIIAILKYKAKRAGRLSHSLSLSQDTKRQMAVNNRLQALELDLVYRQESNSTSAHLDKQDEVLSVYPNPFDEQLYFALNLTQAQELEVVIYDVSAKEVMRIREEMPAGLQNWQLNTQLLEHAGMYFYELKTTTNTHKGFVIKH